MSQNVQQSAAGQQKATMTMEQVITLLGGMLGDTNIQARGLKTALLKNGADIGRTDAVVAIVAGTNGVVEVQHSLGRIPGYCRILTTIPAVGSEYAAVLSPKEYEKWTPTTIRVDLITQHGSETGATVALEIGGERVA